MPDEDVRPVLGPFRSEVGQTQDGFGTRVLRRFLGHEGDDPQPVAVLGRVGNPVDVDAYQAIEPDDLCLRPGHDIRRDAGVVLEHDHEAGAGWLGVSRRGKANPRCKCENGRDQPRLVERHTSVPAGPTRVGEESGV